MTCTGWLISSLPFGWPNPHLPLSSPPALEPQQFEQWLKSFRLYVQRLREFLDARLFSGIEEVPYPCQVTLNLSKGLRSRSVTPKLPGHVRKQLFAYRVRRAAYDP